MRGLMMVVALLLAAGALAWADEKAGDARTGVTNAEVKAEKVKTPGGDKEGQPAAETGEKPAENPAAPLDLKELQEKLAEFESALYHSAEEKIAAEISARVKAHLDELLIRFKRDKTPDPELVRILGFGDKPEAMRELAKLLDSPDAAVRSAAAFSLGIARDKNSVDKLIKLLDDKDGKVANQAAIALGRIGDKGCYEILLKQLELKDALKRLAAVRALGLLGDERAVSRLEEYLPSVEDPLEITAVLDAINRIAGDNLFRIITQLERVAAALEKHGTGHETQLAQAAITEALDRLIDELEKQQQGGQGQGKGKGQKRQTSSGRQPGQTSGSASGQSQGGRTPRANSNAGDVPATDSSLADLTRTAGVVWGNLPPAVQEEITAALKQELPERYQHLLKIYYKILAEGK